MKKYLWVIIVIVILLLIGGYYYFSQAGKVSNKSLTTNVTETKKSLFTSIQDAMSKSLSLKCEYQIEGGKTTTYIKGNMIRVMTETADKETKNGNAIMKDNKMWVWTEGEKEGVLITLSEQISGAEQKTTAGNQTSRQDVIAELEKFKDRCSTAVITDSMFTPPSNVTFSDLSKFQEEMMKGLNSTDVPTAKTTEEAE